MHQISQDTVLQQCFMPSNLQAGSQYHKSDSGTVHELFPKVLDGGGGGGGGGAKSSRGLEVLPALVQEHQHVDTTCSGESWALFFVQIIPAVLKCRSVGVLVVGKQNTFFATFANLGCLLSLTRHHQSEDCFVPAVASWR